MILEKTDNRPFCLPFSFAMVLGIKPEIILEEVGRPMFHIQDMIDVCLRRGYGVTEIQAMPQMCNKVVTMRLDYWDRIWQIISGSKCVLYNKTHAVAWNGKMIYDPKGRIYEIKEFEVQGAYLILPIKERFMI